jgi:hypothetical protein
MKQIATIKQKNYEKASQLLGELFDAASNITEQINCCIQSNGISMFFENLEAFDFSEDVIEKLKAVKTVLFEIDEEAAIQKSKEIKEV